jgi:voltage-gated potassium channel Kch
MALITLVGLVTIGTSTYLILYSHPIYERLAPLLHVFERNVPHREEVTAAPSRQVDVIVLGLGRFGGALARRLEERGHSVLGVDFDPEVVRAWEQEGGAVRYADAEDPEVHQALPLHADWIVSSLPNLHTNLHLLQVLRERNYRGQIALTAHTERAARTLGESGANLVLVPFVEAAAHAAAYIMGEEDLDYPHQHEPVWSARDRVEDLGDGSRLE